MKKFIAAAVVGVGLFLAATPAMAAGLNASQIDAILSLLAVFGADAKVINDVKASLGGGSSSSSNSNSGSSSNTGSNTATKQNLTISSITLGYPALGGSSSGWVPDQTLEVVVKNDQYGSYSLSGEEFNYEVYLYEIVDGDKKQKFKAATGKAFVPYANGYSSFKVNIEGGLPFNDDFEREYIAEVKINTKKKVKESNIKDNSAWSNSWMTDYYKG